TFFRKLVSRRKLLEWVTAADAERRSAHDLVEFWRFMWPTEVITVGASILIGIARPQAWFVAAPFLMVWTASPLIGFWVSRTLAETDQSIDRDDAGLVRLIARRTWKFFETFVGPDDNWLAPDNYQEDPRPVVAHRTS